jgi:hypothetical protein
MSQTLPPHATRGEVSAQRTEGSWASSLALMTPPSPYDGDTSPCFARGGT